MKKALFLILSVLCVLLSACGKPLGSTQINDADNGSSIDSTPSIENEEACYFTYEIETFLSDWKNAQYDSKNAHPLLTADQKDLGENAAITIPVLQTASYQLVLVEATRTFYGFYYYPEGHSYERGYVDYDIAIYVDVYKLPGTFDGFIEQHNVTPVNGIAYSAFHNEWFLNNNGAAITITFPKSLVLENASELESYFTFQKYGVNDIKDYNSST